MPKKSPEQHLELRFHGRILDHLGIQMYQSPVASIAELISNSWDADAERVDIHLPDTIELSSIIKLKDDGIGMTYDDCQNRFLMVGACRRGKEATSKTERKKRPVLGRKGIGKLAGFGICKKIVVDTISHANGERTKFELVLDELRGTEYVSTTPKQIRVIEYEQPNFLRRKEHGTTIELHELVLSKRPPQFEKALSRRFTMNSMTDDFKVFVNGTELTTKDPDTIEFDFPKDLKPTDFEILGILEKDLNFSTDGSIAEEILPDGNTIRWRFVFHDRPISEEDFRGVAVFANGKLAQSPFVFNLSGGIGGQHGLEYLSGQVFADFIDAFDEDLIAPERQRVNWDSESLLPLQLWGQERIKKILNIWIKRRAIEKVKQLEEKVATFSDRLNLLSKSEQTTVRSALEKLASISTLTTEQYGDLGSSILSAWEKGRLRGLIDKIALDENHNENELLSMLIEANVLDALSTAEVVKTKIEIVEGLQTRVEKKQLENSIRDYIAKHPWLIGPQWETFKIERSVKKIIEDVDAKAEKEIGLEKDKRIDLVLASGSQLLLLEFMKPEIKVDFDHINRFEMYVRILRSHIESHTGGHFRTVTGYLIADDIADKSHVLSKIKAMKNEDMFAYDWSSLLAQAASRWTEFLEILGDRAPDDPRLKGITII